MAFVNEFKFLLEPMKQLTENLKDGKVTLLDLTVPTCATHEILVRNRSSLVSAGTEKLMIELGRKNLAAKAVSRPDLARAAFEKGKREGFFNVFREAMARLDQPLPLGYSSSGVVVEVGSRTRGFSVGDAVACAGSGFASHAEFVAVPADLCVKLGSGRRGPRLSFEEASFVMLGGIALQGFRTAAPTPGESVVVVGLGLIGLLTIQIARAYGCVTIGIDIDPHKVRLAKELGADHAFTIGEDVDTAVSNLTSGVGADAVLLTAATKDNGPILLAERIARKRGRIVLVGVSDITLTRKAFWDKELTFSVSKAAGPSSVEPGAPPLLPSDLVRWTEKRNLEEFVRLMESGRVDVRRLITHRFAIAEAGEAYRMILEGKSKYIAIVLEYPADSPATKTVRVTGTLSDGLVKSSELRENIGLIGAGMFTRNVLMRAVEGVKGIRFVGVAAKSGLNSRHVADTYDFEYVASDYHELLKDVRIGSIIITTRHDLHARMVADALRAGKSVFVEKPLGISEQDLSVIEKAYARASDRQVLMVGFNRRYSPLSAWFRKAVSLRSAPMQILYRVNAGFIPGDHWTQDREVGGGRIIGEVCHFVDYLQFLTNADPVEVHTSNIGNKTGRYFDHDNVSICIRFSDGSLGTILYTALGSKLYSRERVEAFAGEIVVVLQDFRKLETIQGSHKKTRRLWNQDMGYRAEMEHFLRLNAEASDELFRQAVLATRTTLSAVESMRTGNPVSIRSFEVKR